MKKVITLFISLMFIVSLCLGVAPTNVLAEEDNPVYVALGDSMAQGYMFTDYNEEPNFFVPLGGHYCGWQGSSERSYIKKFADDIDAELIDLTIQGLQPDEVYAFLDPDNFDFDSMTRGARKHIGWWTREYKTDEEDPQADMQGLYLFDKFEDMSDYYINAVKEADVITYDLGMNYFGTYLNDARDPDEVFTKLLCDSKYTKQIEKIRSAIADVLKKINLESANDLINGLLYACTSYMVYGDKCIAQIKKLNPTVQIIMIPLSNPNRELYYELNGIKINYTQVIDIMFGYLNNYFRNISINKDLYTIAELSAPVMSFVDELYFYPNDLSEDAKSLLNKSLFGFDSVLGSDFYQVPDKIQAIYENLCTQRNAFYPDVFPDEDWCELQIAGAAGYYEYKLEEGKLFIRDSFIDQLIYKWISENYGEEIAYKDFWSEDFASFLISFSPSEESLLGGNAEVLGFPSIVLTGEAIDKARDAIEKGNAKDWQNHIVEAVDAITFGWIPACLKAATYRALPADLALGSTNDVDTIIKTIRNIIVDPEEVTEQDYVYLHAAMRAGNAARGFAVHPCPRGLDVKYDAVKKAYDSKYSYDEIENELNEGTYTLYMDKKGVGEFTFTKIDSKWKIQDSDGKYLSINDGSLIKNDQAFLWEYKDGYFSANDVTVKGILPVFKIYYLSYKNEKLTVVASKNKAAEVSFTKKIFDHKHTVLEETELEEIKENVVPATCISKGYYDVVKYCKECGKELTRVHHVEGINSNGHKPGEEKVEIIDGEKHLVRRCEYCHEIIGEPTLLSAQSFNVNVTVKEKTRRILFFFTRKTYDIEISVTPTKPYFKASKIEYSLDQNSWRRGTHFTTSTKPGNVFIRITDSDGIIHNYKYDGMDVVEGNN